ncbi:MAG TPA: hypothetical protein VGL74_14195 [Terriglobales bacterium]
MRFVWLLATALAASAPLCSETQLGTPTRGDVPSRPTARSSGLIFSGTAVKVEHLRPTGSPGITQITFRVESAIRGVRQGQIIKIREWEGLWSGGERYRTGERVMLFLYPNSKLGLTSPVGGALGRYRVDNAGRILVGSPGTRPKPVTLRNFVVQMRRAAGE